MPELTVIKEEKPDYESELFGLQRQLANTLLNSAGVVGTAWSIGFELRDIAEEIKDDDPEEANYLTIVGKKFEELGDYLNR